MTATIEFTDHISLQEISRNLNLLPFSPKYISHHFEEYTYPIQNTTTRDMISGVKKTLEPLNFFLLGRFSEWEYYNMDAAIGAGIDLVDRLT